MSVFDFDGLLGDTQQEEDDLPLFGEEEHEDNAGEANLGGSEPTADGVKVEPKKRSVRNPRPRLTVETLQGPRGIHVLEGYFTDMKYKGKGHEREDLDEVMRRMQHWAHRMYPNYKFVDVLNTVERLGRKKPLQVHMSRYRLGMLDNMLTEEQLLAETDRLEPEEGPLESSEPMDEFDALLDQQIAMSRLDPRTPVSKIRPQPITPATNSSALSFAINQQAQSTPYPAAAVDTPAPKRKLTPEELARIAENRRLAQERLMARKAAKQQQLQQVQEEQENSII